MSRKMIVESSNKLNESQLPIFPQLILQRTLSSRVHLDLAQSRYTQSLLYDWESSHIFPSIFTLLLAK